MSGALNYPVAKDEPIQDFAGKQIVPYGEPILNMEFEPTKKCTPPKRNYERTRNYEENT